MEEYMMGMMKLKRKELEEVNDDFSDFSLSSPARKIRRLDAGLPPIIEEEEVQYEQLTPESAMSNSGRDLTKPLVIEELPCVPENEEKAIVLFKPMNGSLFHTTSNFSVDPNLISSFKNQALWSTHLNETRPTDEDDEIEETNPCRAVIPWVPSQHPNRNPAVPPASQTEVSESMDAEEMEVSTMEIEEQQPRSSNVTQQQQQQPSEYYNHHPAINEGLQQQQHQWQQQHCLIPQPPQNTTTPIVWYR